MRHLPALPVLLVQLAATVAGGVACSGYSTCPGPPSDQKDIAVAPDVACAIAAQGGVTKTSSYNQFLYGQSCAAACGPGFGTCDLPADYVSAYQAALPSPVPGDPGVGDGGADASAPDADATIDAASAGDASAIDAGVPTCPAVSGIVKVHCATFPCEGRRTEGIDEPRASGEAGLGAYFAACSYLEAGSVHAFARLHRELAAHGAPRDILARIERAEADEARHAALTSELARRFGVEPEVPVAPAPGVRSLFAIALENAVEGCVRETYGATMACFRARRAQDASVRGVMASIAPDECEHADLSFRIARWVTPRLRERERAAIRVAMRQAMDELTTASDDALDATQRAVCGMPAREERRALALLVDREVVSVVSAAA